MAVSSPNLSISLTKNDACTSIIFEDTTGEYGVDGNTDGYNISGGPAHDDVTGFTIVITYNKLPTTITYDFTVAAHIISAATLQIASGTPANILAELPSVNLTFPFTSINPFDLFADYGVAIPEFTDDIYTVSYTIDGEIAGPESFTFTTEESLAVLCASQLCVNQKFAELDWTCECASKKSQQALLGQALINQVGASVDLGDLSVGISALERLASLCENSVGGCGCA